MLLSVVIPVYNERETVEQVVDRVRATPFDVEILLVDDGSTDGTTEIVERLAEQHDAVTLLRTPQNMGKGAALREGFREAGGDIVLVQDADLEYDPADYERLLAPILDGRADVVFGSRFIGGDAHRVLYFWHAVGNRFLTLLSNALTNLNLTDMECCYKVFTRDVVHRLEIRENRFGVEPELAARVARLRCRTFEVGVSYAGRTYQEGKKITWRDGFAAIWCILRYNLIP
jgi:glycosyltransferase involved in cell wall biosynthesis